MTDRHAWKTILSLTIPVAALLLAAWLLAGDAAGDALFALLKVVVQK